MNLSNCFFRTDSIVLISITCSLLASDGKIDSIRQAKSIRIDSHGRIVMTNYNSVPQLQCFSYVHHCAARSRHGLHVRQCRFCKGN